MPSVTGPSASTLPLKQKQSLYSLECFLSSPKKRFYKETHTPVRCVPKARRPREPKTAPHSRPACSGLNTSAWQTTAEITVLAEQFPYKRGYIKNAYPELDSQD